MNDLSPQFPLQACPPSCHNCRLRKSGAFTPVKPEVLDFIEGFRVSTMGVEAGGALVRENQTNAQLFTLYSGWAFRYKSLSDGRRQILNFLLPGDLVGLQQEFGEVSTHGIEALTDCMLCVFQNDSLWDVFREHPRLGYDITWLSAHEESHVDDNLLTTGRRNATERVAMLLMHLYQRLERIGLVEDGTVAFPLNQQHIADALGLSLVHTNKTLRRLSLLGLHELKNGRLRLLNTRALARIAEYYDTPPRLMPLL
ncbi:MAG: Crp/Fnr family transcriptional regulator [Gammaproteobacteria bacterium]|jgi:CRP-like cAMP-binding protein|nr:Crp/Fnr family transcriptional regulator [Gammaproteobacteria bacterium]MBU0826802.1 Crp/Fnr family transcriptional regulator [Gammaproteobacteria bacterium]MBU0890509.1 Crp/Fnr family transcriptional regulator [Gammaproteobacteria bacterium]MBU1351264.1 Crp/Fnr family transcriptional regulator [Gammaproteobacteria bacterium]MBU1505039.1 Crp/Fnr family transcriptional regulator [Gammaproteobacteria bacterium]